MKKAIVFHGSIIDEVMEASKQLEDISIISLSMIAPLDESSVKEMLQNHETVYVTEEHFEEGGLGTILSDFVMKYELKTKIKKIGIKNHFIHKIGNCTHLRKEFNIDALSIVGQVKG